jgi:hypothetical protein
MTVSIGSMLFPVQNVDVSFCAGLALPDCMKLAEDGDDWGMPAAYCLLCFSRIGPLNRCPDARLEEDELWKLRMQGL